MKKSIILTAILSLFLICTSFSALGNETIAPASKDDSPDLTIEILSASYGNHQFDIMVEITNGGTSAVQAGSTLCVCVKVLTWIDLGNNETMSLIVVDEDKDLSSAIATESIPPGTAINASFNVSTSYSKSIIHVRVDPDDLIGESDESNNTDQFDNTKPRPRIVTNPILLKISSLFPRLFKLLSLFFNI